VLGLLAVVAVALLGPLSSTAASQADPPRVSGCSAEGRIEVCFSSPSRRRADGAVINRIRALFDAAGAGDTLRIAMFRWDRAKAADDLLAAQGRGARVEIVADRDMLDNWVGRRLLRRIERRDPGRNNVVVCTGSCLPWRADGPAPAGQNVNHLKLVLSDIGGERSVTVTSSNLVANQYHQYNSLIRVTVPGLYAFHLDYFRRLRKQSLSVGGQTWDDGDKAYPGSPTAVVYPRRTDLDSPR